MEWIEGEGFEDKEAGGQAKPGENRFKNTSGPKGDLNPGNRSKFNPEQAIERLRVHAVAIATGSPTFAQIVSHWHERYGIEISIPSEKEFRKTHRAKIERIKHDLIETGEIAIPVVSEEILADSLMDLTIQTGMISKDIRRKITTVLRSIDLEAPQGEVDRAKNADQIKLFSILTEAMTKLNKSSTDQIDKLFVFSSKIKIKDKKIQRIVDERFDDRMRNVEEDEDDGVTEGELVITDELRQKLLGDGA